MYRKQLFAEAVKGKKIVYLFRVYDNGTTETGRLLAFTTANGRSVSKDADATKTKDGSIRTPGEPEIEISATAVVTKGDDLPGKLQDAMLADKLIECWEVNLEEPGTGQNKFKGTYYQGYITSTELSAGAEDFAELTIAYGANGIGQKGDVTVTQEEQEAATYVFADTVLRMAITPTSVSVVAGDTEGEDITCSQATGTITATAPTGITATVATNTVTIKAAQGTAAGAYTVSITDGQTTYKVPVTVTAAG